MTTATKVADTPAAHALFARDLFTWLAYLMLGYYAYLQASLGPLMPFLSTELSLNYTISGLHFSAYALGMTLAGLSGERAAQRWGRRPYRHLQRLWDCHVPVDHDGDHGLCRQPPRPAPKASGDLGAVREPPYKRLFEKPSPQPLSRRVEFSDTYEGYRVKRPHIRAGLKPAPTRQAT